MIIVINYKKARTTLSLGREKSRQIKPETGRDTALFSSVQVYWSVSNSLVSVATNLRLERVFGHDDGGGLVL